MKEETKTFEACSRPECQCLHEKGLVEVQNADGSFSQMKAEDVEKELLKMKNLQKAMNGGKQNEG